MNSKETHEFNKENFPNFYNLSDEKFVEDLINKLIESLYIPVKGHESITRVDRKRIKHFKIDEDEPINWADLGCIEVKKLDDGTFLAIVEEASPQRCETFCEYIEEMMKSYGWNVKVETEW